MEDLSLIACGKGISQRLWCFKGGSPRDAGDASRSLFAHRPLSLSHKTAYPAIRECRTGPVRRNAISGRAKNVPDRCWGECHGGARSLPALRLKAAPLRRPHALAGVTGGCFDCQLYSGTPTSEAGFLALPGLSERQHSLGMRYRLEGYCFRFSANSFGSKSESIITSNSANERPHLISRATAFCHGERVIHAAEHFRVRESNSAKGSVAQNGAWRWLSPCPEEKTGSGVEEGMPPSVQDDACDVPLGIKPPTREHICELPANHAFVIHEGRGEQLGSSFRTLVFGGQPRTVVRSV